MTTTTPETLAADLPEPVAHMYPSDLKAFETSERSSPAFSVAVGNPSERSVPLFTLSQLVEYAESLRATSQGGVPEECHRVLNALKAIRDDYHEGRQSMYDFACAMSIAFSEHGIAATLLTASPKPPAVVAGDAVVAHWRARAAEHEASSDPEYQQYGAGITDTLNALQRAQLSAPPAASDNAQHRLDVAYQAVMDADGITKDLNLTRLGDWLGGHDVDPASLLVDVEAPPAAGEPVGEAVNFAAHGLTMATFDSSVVPAGTTLYTAPQPAQPVATSGPERSINTDGLEIVAFTPEGFEAYCSKLLADDRGRYVRDAMASNLAAVGELPDDVRVPLDSIWADINYLISRVEVNSAFQGVAVESVKARIDQAKAAVLAKLASDEETVRHLNHALREATEGDKFMGEPARASASASAGGGGALDDWILTLQAAHDESLNDEHTSARAMLRGVIEEMEAHHGIQAAQSEAGGGEKV